MRSTILITGGAGCIGSHTCIEQLASSHEVEGGQIAQMLREGDSGHTVVPGDAETLAARIRELCDADKRIALARWHSLLTGAPRLS